nr:CvpA family protein [uncultured Butyrivibrio sp.]
MISFDISQIVLTIVVVCLILWRMSYGWENGLFAEATGLIAVIASFVAVYYSINIVGSLIEIKIGSALSKIGYLVVAFVVYKIMTAIANAFRKLKNIPIIGSADRFLGGLLGIAEACLIIALIEYVTDIAIVSTVLTTFYELLHYIQKTFINK